jgi:hypothetical protein
MRVLPMSMPSTSKRTLSLNRRVVCELSDHERLLASEGWSLWTCEIQERPDPLTPIEDIPVERLPERERFDLPEMEDERVPEERP